MKIRFALALVAVALLLGGCASQRQSQLPLSRDLLASKSSKLGVAMTMLPKADTQFPGAACLLCFAAASIANSSLTAHMQTLTPEDLPKLKDEVAKALRAGGWRVGGCAEPLELKNLAAFRSNQPNFAAKDFSSFKGKYGIDKLLV